MPDAPEFILGLPLIVAGFVVAFLHAALPTHWLPFVLVARARRWTTRRALAVAAFAGLGHVACTIILGAAVLAAGMVAAPWLGHGLHWIAGGLLVALGLYQLMGHAHGGEPRHYRSDAAAALGLFLLLAVSPCEAFLPLYLANAGAGWGSFALLSGVLLVATTAGMMVFTALSLAGVSRLKLAWLARREPAILGGVMCLLGVAMIAIEL
jgi:nickel/cobalt exporter